MKEKKQDRRLGLVKLEVFINLDSMEKEEDCIEIDFNYARGFVKKDIRSLIENFGQDVQDYIELNKEVEQDEETNNM